MHISVTYGESEKEIGKKSCLLSLKHLDLTGLAKNYSTHEKFQVKSNATKKFDFWWNFQSFPQTWRTKIFEDIYITQLGHIF